MNHLFITCFDVVEKNEQIKRIQSVRAFPTRVLIPICHTTDSCRITKVANRRPLVSPPLQPRYSINYFPFGSFTVKWNVDCKLHKPLSSKFKLDSIHLPFVDATELWSWSSARFKFNQIHLVPKVKVFYQLLPIWFIHFRMECWLQVTQTIKLEIQTWFNSPSTCRCCWSWPCLFYHDYVLIIIINY